MSDIPGFRVPNDSESTDDAQQELHKSDLQILGLAGALTGVVNGCAPTASGTPDQNVQVAAGLVIVGGKLARVTAGAVAMAAAHATLPRYDLVTVDGSGTKATIDGTAAANPDKPDLGSSELAVLAEIWRPANDNTIETDKIVDKRVFERALALGNLPFKSTWWYGYPEGAIAAGSGAAMSANQMRFVPFVLRQRTSFDRVACRATTAYTGAPTLRLGIYYAGADGLPGALRTDYGSMTVSGSTGEQSITISDTIDPGVYWLAAVLQGTVSPGAMVAPLNVPWGMSSLVSGWRGLEQGSVSGALPDPATPVSSAGDGPGIYLRAA